MTYFLSARADHKPKGGSAPCDRRALSILDGSMHSEPKSLSRTGGIPEENRRGPEPERGDAETRMRSPFLSRRFVIGSLVAFGILVANAFVTYRTIANLIEASRIAENTLKVVEALKDLQNDVADSQIELRGYIISGERDRLERARAFLERTAKYVETLRALSGAIPDQTQQIESLGAQIGEELARFGTLIEIHERNGVAATIRNIRETAGPATIHRVELLTAELQGAADTRLARRAIQAQLGSQRHHRRRRDAVQPRPARPCGPARAAGNQGEAAGGRGGQVRGDARPSDGPAQPAAARRAGQSRSRLGKERGTRRRPAVHRSGPFQEHQRRPGPRGGRQAPAERGGQGGALRAQVGHDRAAGRRRIRGPDRGVAGPGRPRPGGGKDPRRGGEADDGVRQGIPDHGEHRHQRLSGRWRGFARPAE